MKHRLLSTAMIASAAALLIAAGPKADLNQDGEVTKSEFTQAAQSKFFATDTNNDGLLSQDERKAHRQAMRENRKDRRFEKLDTNGDGLLSKDEVNARGEKRKAKKEARQPKRNVVKTARKLMLMATVWFPWTSIWRFQNDSSRAWMPMAMVC